MRLGEYDLQTTVDCDDTTDQIEENCAPPVNDIFIESSHPHPDYKAGTANRHHDIALIRLSNPVNFTSKYLFSKAYLLLLLARIYLKNYGLILTILIASI